MKWTVSAVLGLLILVHVRPVQLQLVQACTTVCYKSGMCGPASLHFRFLTCHFTPRSKHEKHYKSHKIEQKDDIKHVHDIRCLGTGPNIRNLSTVSCLFDKCEITNKHVMKPSKTQCSLGICDAKPIGSQWYNCSKSFDQQSVSPNCGQEDRENTFQRKINLYKHAKGKDVQSKKKRNATGYKEVRDGKDIVFVKLYTDVMRWDDALKVCEADGGTLLRVDSKYKETQIGITFPLKGDEWIGLKDIYRNNTYYWTDGTLPNYTNWRQNQPSHVVIDFRQWAVVKEDCVQLSGTPPRWNDCSCDTLRSFLCQIEH